MRTTGPRPFLGKGIADSVTRPHDPSSEFLFLTWRGAGSGCGNLAPQAAGVAPLTTGSIPFHSTMRNIPLFHFQATSTRTSRP